MARDIIDDRLLGALHIDALHRNGFAHLAHEEHAAFQVGTLDALIAGRFDGDATLGELLDHGTLGLGTVQHLGGELIVIDGDAFVARVDGSLEQVPRSLKTPFAVVTDFSPSRRTELSSVDFAALTAAIDEMGFDPDVVVSLRVEGTFSDLVVRSVPEQRPPYRPLSEVVHDQHEWTLEEANGTLVGFRFPDRTAGVEVPGYHLHFIAQDRTTGGHVVDLSIDHAVIEVDASSQLHVELPEGVGLGQPGVADRAQIRSIEGGGGRSS
jgi:acetolactate decarboxylase